MFMVLQMLKEVQSYSIKAQVLPLAAKDRSDLPCLSPVWASLLISLLMSPEHSNTLLAVAPAGPAAWNALPLHPHVTGSQTPFGAFFTSHLLTNSSLDTSSNVAIPGSSCAPFCFISLFSTHHYLVKYVSYLFYLFFVPPLEWTFHEDRAFVSLLTIVYSALNIDCRGVDI